MICIKCKTAITATDNNAIVCNLCENKHKSYLEKKHSKLDYPHNLYKAVFGGVIEMPIDWQESLKCVLETLTPREGDVIVKRFEHYWTLRDCATAHNVTHERIRQIEGKALRKLRRSTSKKILEFGLAKTQLEAEAHAKAVEKYKESVEKSIQEEIQAKLDKMQANNDIVPNMNIDEIGLSVRAYNALKRVNINTLREATLLTASDLARIRNVGIRTALEIIKKCKEYGVPIQDT